MKSRTVEREKGGSAPSRERSDSYHCGKCRKTTWNGKKLKSEGTVIIKHLR